MIARAPWPHRTVSGLLFALLVTAWAGTNPASAADPPIPNPLDRPIADMALVTSGAGPDAPPMLLTLDTVDLPGGSVRVALLDRARGWLAVDSETVTLFETDGGETPWLIELAPGRFVIIATSHAQNRTALVKLGVSPGAAAPLTIEPSPPLAMAVDDAGAIDVDGDGGIELVVSAARTTRGADACAGSVVSVLDGASLTPRAEYDVPDMRLAGGALGEWDGEPGGELLAYTYGNCPAGPDSAQRLGVVAIRLADGVPTAILSPDDPSGSTTLPGVPLVADLDGDGRDEVVIHDGAALAVLEPARGWSRTEIGGREVLPLAALGADGDGRAGVVVWIDGLDAEDGLTMSMANVGRTVDGSLGLTEERLDLTSVAPARRSRVIQAFRDAAAAQAIPQAWVGDIDRDGCAEILAPLLITECAGDDDRSMAVGAAWFATRPVVAFDARDSRELLIAGTMEWDPAAGRPRAATPAAIARAGAWRHGPSSRFALSEVRAGDAAYFNRFPAPRPTIERAPVDTRGTDFPGFTGSRVLVRVIGAGPEDPTPPEAPSLDAFLTDPPSGGERVSIERIAVPAGAESGRDGSFVHVSLADVEAPGSGLAERWTVTIAQVNDWGEVAGPIRGTINLNSTGPSLTLDVPFLSAPWPFDATLQGRSEPGVEVRGATGGSVVSDRRGRFEVKTQLAPWPQTVELIAVDETGNTTTKRFSLVGGVDYRDLPWGAILAVVLLLGAILSAGRGTQTMHQVENLPDYEPLPEIEELPTVRGVPRA